MSSCGDSSLYQLVFTHTYQVNIFEKGKLSYAVAKSELGPLFLGPALLTTLVYISPVFATQKHANY